MEKRTMKLGFLYAGQGSQHPGMGADLYETCPAFRSVLDRAAEQVDFDLKEISFIQIKNGVLEPEPGILSRAWWPLPPV